jgi:hypothetical protein
MGERSGGWHGATRVGREGLSVTAYLREFEIDIFISYAGMDDDQYPGETVGWVAQLQADLAQRVKYILERKSRFGVIVTSEINSLSPKY